MCRMNDWFYNLNDNHNLMNLLEEISVALDRCVDYGVTVIDTIIDNPRNEYVDSSIGLLLRDYLELLDGVSQLIRSGSAESAIPLCRTMFEYYLSILYILDNHEVNRALSYQVSHVKQRLKSYKKLGPDRDKFNQMLERNGYDFTVPDDGYDEGTSRLNGLLKREPFKRINKEWHVAKNKNNNYDPNWYSLFGGPKSIRDLARYLNKDVEYDVLYRAWSQKTHASSAIHSMTKYGIKKIRHPENFTIVSTWSFNWTFYLFDTTLKTYREHKRVDWASFYLKHINNTSNKLTNLG